MLVTEKNIILVRLSKIITESRLKCMIISVKCNHNTVNNARVLVILRPIPN